MAKTKRPHARMSKGRLEAFSDGVIAILITIMMLELKVPHVAELAALKPLIPVLLCYALSFVFLGIYWNNHHHMLQAAEHVTGPVLWANHHLLFWLSLVPFATAWMGENHFAPAPTAAYGAVLAMCAIAYTILQHLLVVHHPADSALARATGSDGKGKLSLLAYVAAVPLSFVDSRIAWLIYVGVALIWLVPDRRIERALGA